MPRTPHRPPSPVHPDDTAPPSDGALLGSLLGIDPSEAESRIRALGGCDALRHAGLEYLTAEGWPTQDAIRMIAAREFVARCSAISKKMRAVVIEEPRHVFNWARGRLTCLDYEELWLLALNSRNRLIAARRVASGGISGVRSTTSDVLRMALREGASGFVIVHNHPSGDSTPSAEDILFSRRLLSATQACDLPFLDHVVVSETGFASALPSP